MTEKRKVILYLSLFFTAILLLVPYGFYAESVNKVSFDEFSINAPPDSEF